MKLSYNRNAKDPIYYIQKGKRNGKKTTTSNVYTVGKHSDLLKITADPLAYAKEKVAEFNAAEKAGTNNSIFNFKVDFTQKVKATKDIASKQSQFNIGYLFLQTIYSQLNLSDFFEKVTKDLKIKYDCNDINRFLTFARVLDPKSKYGTYDRLSTYYENRDECDIRYQHILRFMTLLSQNYDSYLEHLFTFSSNIVPRNTSVCYYDCTNYFFEIEMQDEDYIDPETGEYIKGMRKYARAKDHKPNPVVQMGLFMDGNGIPISMCITSGSDNEQTTALPLEKKILKMFRNKQFIYCADAGLGSFDIRRFNDMGGRAFIVTQSVKKLSDVLKAAVFNDYDYKLLSNNAKVSLEHLKTFDKTTEGSEALYNDKAYKVIYAPNAFDLGLYEEKVQKNGKVRRVKSKATLHQSIIVTFSRKYMDYQRNVRNRQIERAKKLISSGTVEDVKKGPNDVTRLIKRTSKAKSGETAAIDVYEIDTNTIAEEEKYDGFYAVATNLDDDPKAILEINGNRYKIEDCFRVLKSNFDARPIYHSNSDRITAHFMICYTALLIYRLLEQKLIKAGCHFTIDQIIDTLKNMNLVNQHDEFYEALYGGSDVCTALNAVFPLDLDLQFYRPTTLNKKIKNIS